MREGEKMAIHVNPERFENIASKPLNQSQYLQPKERQELVEEGVKSRIDGDVYIQEGVRFKHQTKAMLRSEILEKPNIKLEKGEVFVAFRNPDDEEEVLVIKMDRETLAQLRLAFGEKDFFQRKDGIVRLNGQGERYVAGWLKEINHNRGYMEADVDKNGVIDNSEQNSLHIGFDRQTVYEHAGEDVTSVGTRVGARRYQAYGDTYNANNPTDTITTQALKFKSTAHEELLYTIKMDENKDGIVTLEEGLEEFVPSREELHEHLVQKIKQAHLQWIRMENPILEPNLLAYRDISMLEISTKKEREEELEKMKEQSDKIMENLEKDWILN